jgi:hypothetical protein
MERTTSSVSALRMKYAPRSGDNWAVERAKGGETVRLDKSLANLRTGARPLDAQAVQDLPVGAHVGVVVNGNAWPAEKSGDYNPLQRLLPVRYFPERNLPAHEVEHNGQAVKVPITVVGIASVPVSDVFAASDITIPFPEPIKMPKAGGGIKWGTLAASASMAPREYIVFADGTVEEFTTCDSCGGQTADGAKTCPNCGGKTTAYAAPTLDERLAGLEAAVAALADLEFGKMPPQFAANAKKKKDAAKKNGDGGGDSKPPWLKKKIAAK